MSLTMNLIKIRRNKKKNYLKIWPYENEGFDLVTVFSISKNTKLYMFLQLRVGERCSWGLFLTDSAQRSGRFQSSKVEG